MNLKQGLEVSENVLEVVKMLYDQRPISNKSINEVTFSHVTPNSLTQFTVKGNRKTVEKISAQMNQNIMAYGQNQEMINTLNQIRKALEPPKQLEQSQTIFYDVAKRNNVN